MTRRLRELVLVAVAALILPGCQKHETELAESEPIRPVLSVVAEPRGEGETGYSGTVEARYQTDSSFRLLGRIVSRVVDVGDQVTAGQLLAELDPVELEIAVRSATASMANAEAQRDNAASSLDRQILLQATKASSQSDFDMAKKNAEEAKSAVAQAQTNVDKAREELSYASLKADIDGVVTGIFAEVGQTVGAGQTVMSIANPDQREAVVDIGEEVISTITVGAEYRLVLQINNKFQCMGKVREIAPQVDTKTRTSRVRISLTNPPEGFRLGATIKAFSLSDKQTNVYLPQTAILDRDGESFVWLVETTEKQVKRVPVKIVKRDAHGVEIQSGVSVGDRVVTAGVNTLTDGQLIRWRNGDEQ